LARARVELDRTTIRAPYDGVLGAKRVDEGDQVSTEIPLVRIDAVDRLQLLFTVVESYSALVQPGIPVTIQVAPYPDEVFPGEVFFVSPTLDPALRRLPCKAWIPNPDHRLRPGLFAQIQAEIAQRADAILIPESALAYGLEGPFVWKVDSDNRPSQVLVELGERQDGRVEVTIGLSPGDVVVSGGVHKVMEGVPISPAEPVTTAAPDISETNGS
jgi:membrane fusion protein (multidrug efflux system)